MVFSYEYLVLWWIDLAELCAILERENVGFFDRVHEKILNLEGKIARNFGQYPNH